MKRARIQENAWRDLKNVGKQNKICEKEWQWQTRMPITIKTRDDILVESVGMEERIIISYRYLIYCFVTTRLHI